MAAGKKSRPVLKWIAFLLIAAAAAAGGWYYYFGSDKEVTYSFETATIDQGLIEQSVSATGSVQALITVDLSSPLSGQVEEVAVDFNSRVKKGDLLATLDKKTFEAKMRAAEANLAMAKAGVAVQKSNIVKSEALVNKAELELARQSKLAERGTASQSVLESAMTGLATAKADLAVAKAQLENANALVRQRESDLAQVKIDLDRTEIRSPIDGVVIARNTDPGATVASSLQAPVLFRIAQDLSKIQIETQVDEADIGRIADGNEVTFTVDAFPDRTFRGKVAQVRIGGVAESSVVTYTVVVAADNPRTVLLPGMTATVRIVTGRKEDVLRVPNGAVRFQPPRTVPGASTRPRWGRNEAFIAELSERLKMTDEQKAKFAAELEDLRARRINLGNIERNGGNGGNRGNRASGDRRRADGARRDRPAGARPGSNNRRRGAITRILRKILDDEQMKIWREWRTERRETTRPAVVWLLEDEKLVPRRIRLGLIDEAYSEIASGTLKAGDKVVTRVRANGGSGKSRRRRRRP